MLKSKRKSFLKKAEQLANLIFEKLRELRHTPMKDVGLGSMLSLLKLQSDFENVKEGDDVDMSYLEPKIYEVILFGSVAAGKKNPTDIDLMIIDNGHFSNFFPCTMDGHETEDLYADLTENLSMFTGLWFNVNEMKLAEILGDTEVDLHILPLKVLKSEDFRKEVGEKHKDLQFFKNALSSAMRYDFSEGKFKPLKLEYLEKRYRCQLNDLK